MSEYRASSVHPLAYRKAVRHVGLQLETAPEGAIFQVIASSTSEAAAVTVTEIAAQRAWDVRPAGPGQWFLVGDQPLSPVETQRFLGSLPLGIDAFDQSHGRARIRIGGPTAAQLVAKGTAIDLSNFTVGSATTTLVGHVAGHLTRVSETSFEMMVLRGFAESLWDDLVRMTTEFA